MKVLILADCQEQFKSLINTDKWSTFPLEDGGYFVTDKPNKPYQRNEDIVIREDELIDISDNFGSYTVVGLNFRNINRLAYLELELDF